MSVVLTLMCAREWETRMRERQRRDGTIDTWCCTTGSRTSCRVKGLARGWEMHGQVGQRLPRDLTLWARSAQQLLHTAGCNPDWILRGRVLGDLTQCPKNWRKSCLHRVPFGDEPNLSKRTEETLSNRKTQSKLHAAACESRSLPCDMQDFHPSGTNT
jgi:hypothetical protein